MIYISYSRIDSPVVKEICDGLIHVGLQLYVDYKQYDSGESTIEITRQIQNADAVILFYSNNVENSPWTRREVEYAISTGKTIIPVLLSNYVDDGWFVNHIHTSTIEFKEGYPSECVSRIVAILKTKKDTHREDKEKPSVSVSQPIKKEKKKRSVRRMLIALYILLVVIFVPFTIISIMPSLRSYRNNERHMMYSPLVKHGDDVMRFINNHNDDDHKTKYNYSGRRRGDKLSADSPNVKDTLKTVYSQCPKITNVPKDKPLKPSYVPPKTGKSYLWLFMIISFLSGSGIVLLFLFVTKSRKKNLNSQGEKTIKCFIAGSKKLQAERDALRAVTCVMYNKWASRKFRILSYTFEDFERTAVIGGHQKKYNEFIEHEADWTLFVINGSVGKKTIEEYRIAMDTYKKNGKPKILAFAKVGSEDNEDVMALKAEINKEGQYWTDYTDINSLKLLYESSLNWDLIGLFQN